MQAKVGNPTVEKRVELILQQAQKHDKIISVDFVAKFLNLSWVTARAVLQEMVIKEKAKTVKTPAGLQYFVLGEKKSKET